MANCEDFCEKASVCAPSPKKNQDDGLAHALLPHLSSGVTAAPPALRDARSRLSLGPGSGRALPIRVVFVRLAL